MPARQLGDVAIEGIGGGDKAVREIFFQRLFIDLFRDLGMAEQGAQLGGKPEESITGRIVKRFFPEPVAADEQSLARTIVDRKREHSVQAQWKVFPPFLVPVHQHFGIGMIGSEDVSPGQELVPEIQVVIDLAVEDDADLAILVPHRLLAPGDIEYRQSPVRQENAIGSVDERARSIRPPVDNRVTHRLQVTLAARADKTRDAAHLFVTRQIDRVSDEVYLLVLGFVIGAHVHLGNQPHQDAHDTGDECEGNQQWEWSQNERRILKELQIEREQARDKRQRNGSQTESAEHVDRLVRIAGEEFHYHQIQNHFHDSVEPVFGVAMTARQVIHRDFRYLAALDRKSTRLNSSHLVISYA